jgi:hypothetical protein
MRTKVVLVSILLVFVLGSCLLPSVNALTLEIGTKISESDKTYFDSQFSYYDSGCVVHTESDFSNDVQLLFDNNASTGINKNYGPGHNWMMIFVFFPYPYYVNNITVKPMFGGNVTNYTLSAFSSGPLLDSFCVDLGVQKTFIINCKITGIRFWLDNKGTNQFNCNDVIINYTPRPTDVNESILTVNSLVSLVNSLQNKTTNLTNQISMINNRITELNNSDQNFNKVQQDIMENITKLWVFNIQLNESITNLLEQFKSFNVSIQKNITNLWATYNRLNHSMLNLYNEIEHYNFTTLQNFTQLENDIILIQNDVNNLLQDLNNLSEDVDTLPEIQDLINQTTFEINNLNTNITEIKNTMPAEYDETVLQNRIIQLELENTILKNEIFNNTAEIELITSELEKIKTTDNEKVIEKKADNTISYSAILLGILGIVIAVLAIGLLFKKMGKPPEPPTKEPRTGETPEQHDIPETETISQEQIQEISETQVQESTQMQQQGIG